jgi:hypothetical protein
MAFLPGSHGFSPWAIIFRHSVAGFMVHFKKLICALFVTAKDFQFAIAGHIVAGTATDIERKQLDSLLAALEK